jgi:hypothetical protein
VVDSWLHRFNVSWVAPPLAVDHYEVFAAHDLAIRKPTYDHVANATGTTAQALIGTSGFLSVFVRAVLPNGSTMDSAVQSSFALAQ